MAITGVKVVQRSRGNGNQDYAESPLEQVQRDQGGENVRRTKLEQAISVLEATRNMHGITGIMRYSGMSHEKSFELLGKLSDSGAVRISHDQDMTAYVITDLGEGRLSKYYAHKKAGEELIEKLLGERRPEAQPVEQKPLAEPTAESQERRFGYLEEYIGAFKSGNLEKLLKILIICKDPHRATKITHRASLEHTHTVARLELLVETGLLEAKGDADMYRPFYVTTQEGNNFLSAFPENLLGLMVEGRIKPPQLRNSKRDRSQKPS